MLALASCNRLTVRSLPAARAVIPRTVRDADHEAHKESYGTPAGGPHRHLALVAQWIERCSPKARAQVRFLPGARSDVTARPCSSSDITSSRPPGRSSGLAPIPPAGAPGRPQTVTIRTHEIAFLYLSEKQLNAGTPTYQGADVCDLVTSNVIELHDRRGVGLPAVGTWPALQTVDEASVSSVVARIVLGYAPSLSVAIGRIPVARIPPLALTAVGAPTRRSR